MNKGDKKDQTQYMADYPLWVVARYHKRGGGMMEIETTWLKNGEIQGPAVFVSALDAEIYCRNLLAREKGLRRMQLGQIDLAQMFHGMGGEMYCQMVFGFAAMAHGALALRNGYLRPMFVPLHFELNNKKGAPVTFNFNSWVFDFMREQWTIIGAADYPEQLGRLGEGDDHAVDRLADAAWQCMATTTAQQDSDDWGVYIPGANAWKYGPRELRQTNNLH